MQKKFIIIDNDNLLKDLIEEQVSSIFEKNFSTKFLRNYNINNLNELDAILTYSGAIQSNYNRLKNEGTFYLKSEDQSSFAFGNDVMFSEEDFAKERGYVSFPKTLGDLQVDNPEKYKKFQKDVIFALSKVK